MVIMEEQNVTTQFKIKRSQTQGRMILELSSDFNHEHWDALSAATKQQIDAGVQFWDIDLRRLQVLNSLLIGALVGLNMILQSHHGNLRLIVVKDSRIAHLIHLAKLNRIMTLVEL